MAFCKVAQHILCNKMINKGKICVVNVPFLMKECHAQRRKSMGKEMVFRIPRVFVKEFKRMDHKECLMLLPLWCWHMKESSQAACISFTERPTLELPCGGVWGAQCIPLWVYTEGLIFITQSQDRARHQFSNRTASL